MTDSVNRILSALSAVRVPAAPGEYDLHALIAAALDEAAAPLTVLSRIRVANLG